jgi:hypothetical protein
MLRSLADRATLERLAARAGVQLPVPEGSVEGRTASGEGRASSVESTPGPAVEQDRPADVR